MSKKMKLYTLSYGEAGCYEGEVLVYSTKRARDKDMAKLIKELEDEAKEYGGEWEDNYWVSELDVKLDEGYGQ
jgi:hypothetical protein